MADINKPAIIANVAKRAHLSKAAAGRAINALTGFIISNVKDGNKVKLIGFGEFVSRYHKARKGHNPQNQKRIKIAAHNSPAFKAGANFRKIVKANTKPSNENR